MEHEDSPSIDLLIDEFQKATVGTDDGDDDVTISPPAEEELEGAWGISSSSSSSPSPAFIAGLNSDGRSTPPGEPLSSPPVADAGDGGGGGEGVVDPAQFLQDLIKNRKPPRSELWQIEGKLHFMTHMLTNNQIEYPHLIDTKTPRNFAFCIGIGCLNQETIHYFIQDLRMMQDMLMLAEETEVQNRRELCGRAADLEQEFLKYLYWQVVPVYPPSYCRRITSQAQTDHAGSVTENGGPLQSESAGLLGSLPGTDHTESCSRLSETTIKPAHWNGILPKPGCDDRGVVYYSCKVFLGGLHSDISDNALIQFFSSIGRVQIERLTGAKENMFFAYAIFESQEQVHHLLRRCGKDQEGKWFIPIPSERHHSKPVEVVPWSVANNKFHVSPLPEDYEDHGDAFTVYVGALHGLLNAEGLAFIMDQMFGGVLRTRIDTDRLHYPSGSGQVVFYNYRSYFACVTTQFLDVQTDKFRKTFQVDPYLPEISFCSYCNAPDGSLFCRDLSCFRPHCSHCYDLVHQNYPESTHQPPITRKFSAQQHLITTSGPPPGLPPPGLNQDPLHFDYGMTSIPTSQPPPPPPPPGLAPFQPFPFNNNVSSPAPFLNGPRMPMRNGVEGTFHSSRQSSNGGSTSGRNSANSSYPLHPPGTDGGTPNAHGHGYGNGRGRNGWLRTNRGFRFTYPLRPRQIYRH